LFNRIVAQRENRRISNRRMSNRRGNRRGKPQSYAKSNLNNINGEAVNAAISPPRCRGKLAFRRGIPRDERTGNHRTTMRDVTPRSPKNHQ
jgi:hypothetical protein